MKNDNRYLKEEINPYTSITAIEEASRCLLCHDSPCSKSCPAETNPGKFIRSIRFNNIKGAIETIRTNNILGGICSRICPQDRLCESACSRGNIDKPIEIGRLQRFATDFEKNMNFKVLHAPKVSKEKVALIGSGPSSLTVASGLAMKGYSITIFEEKPKAGGFLSYGIIPSRLPQSIVDYEIEYIKNLGIEFKFNIKVGKDITIDELRDQGYKAFFLGTGTPIAKTDTLLGSDSIEVITAVEFLGEAKSNEGTILIGQNIIIIGGGDVAIDCASTAKLLGAKKVTVIYRNSKDDMPANIKEFKYAQSIGVNFIFEFKPVEIINNNGHVTSIECTGKNSKSNIKIEADMIILAIGQKTYDLNIIADIKLDSKNLVSVDNKYKCQTNIPFIFAAGDVIDGKKTVVHAVASGKIACESIDEFLTSLRKNKIKKHEIIKNNHKDLSIEFCGIKCENPFFLSSSPVGSNYEMCAKALDAGWAGLVFKTVGIFIADECSPRFDITRKESTSFIGFKNMEQISDKPLETNLEVMAKLKKNYPNKILIASIMGSSSEEWAELARLVTNAGADIIECNFSCPQMTSHTMGSDVGQNPELVHKYCKIVSEATHLPIMAKMTPNIGNMEIPAIAAIEGGATSISAINTIKSISNINLDKFSGMPVINGKSSISGYSGKAVKPIALRFIAQLAQNPNLSNIPLSGMGGIETWEDATEFIMLGCRNIQVTTSVMQYGYRIIDDLISGLSYFMDEKKFNTLDQIVGIALPNIISAEKLDRDYQIIPNIDITKCIGCGRCYLSCFDGSHQAIEWDKENRIPKINKNCVGCHLCINVCPIENCITPGEIQFKKNRIIHEVF